MSAAGVEKQFEAAVQLIKGLPKDGPFQPSNDMKLRLYGYFKQATQGPCRDPAPSFWDVVGKAKWGAWKANGDMRAEQAMRSYVDEIKQVMETMSLTDDMSSLMDTLGPVYEYVDESQANPTASDVPVQVSKSASKKQVRFRTDENGKIDSRSDVERHVPPVITSQTTEGKEGVDEVMENGHSPVMNGETPSPLNGNVAHGNGVAPTENGEANDVTSVAQTRPTSATSSRASVASDTDDEEFLDPMADPVVSVSEVESRRRLDRLQNQLDHLSQLMDASSAGITSAPPARPAHDPPGLTHPDCRVGRDQIIVLIGELRADLETLNRRFVHMELRQKTQSERAWSVVPELSSRSLLLLLAWPLVIQLVAAFVRSRRRHR